MHALNSIFTGFMSLARSQKSVSREHRERDQVGGQCQKQKQSIVLYLAGRS